MRRAGQAKAQAYDWPRVTTQVLDYYEEVLERRAAAVPTPHRQRFDRVRRVARKLMPVLMLHCAARTLMPV
jgi:hypothetical protein